MSLYSCSNREEGLLPAVESQAQIVAEMNRCLDRLVGDTRIELASGDCGRERGRSEFARYAKASTT